MEPLPLILLYGVHSVEVLCYDEEREKIHSL